MAYFAKLEALVALPHGASTRAAIRAARNNIVHGNVLRKRQGTPFDPTTWRELVPMLEGLPDALKPSFIVRLDRLLEHYREAS